MNRKQQQIGPNFRQMEKKKSQTRITFCRRRSPDIHTKKKDATEWRKEIRLMLCKRKRRSKKKTKIESKKLHFFQLKRFEFFISHLILAQDNFNVLPTVVIHHPSICWTNTNNKLSTYFSPKHMNSSRSSSWMH